MEKLFVGFPILICTKLEPGEVPDEPAETNDAEDDGGDDASAADGDATEPAAPAEGGAAETMISALMLLSLAFF